MQVSCATKAGSGVIFLRSGSLQYVHVLVWHVSLAKGVFANILETEWYQKEPPKAACVCGLFKVRSGRGFLCCSAPRRITH